MIEKAFDKTYKIRIDGVPKNVLSRVANRLIKEYKEANCCGEIDVPNEIRTIAEQIKQGVESEEYEYEYVWDSPAASDRVYDSCKNTIENRVHAFWDEDEYDDTVYHVTWYFFSSEYYSKYIGGKKLTGGNYHDIFCKVIAAKGKYRYFCTHRPPSPGVIPDGFVSYDTYSSRERYVGEVTYNEKPSSDELENWGLIRDKNWDDICRAYEVEE